MAGGVEGLSIYGYPPCPYCQRVLRVVDALGLDIELCNTMSNAEYRAELYQATGRTTVPVLRIETGQGQVDWLTESEDIVDYLEDRYRKPS